MYHHSSSIKQTRKRHKKKESNQMYVVKLITRIMLEGRMCTIRRKTEKRQDDSKLSYACMRYH